MTLFFLNEAYLIFTITILLGAILLLPPHKSLLTIGLLLLTVLLSSLQKDPSSIWQSMAFSLGVIVLTISVIAAKQLILLSYQTIVSVKNAPNPFILWRVIPLWFPIFIALVISFSLASWRNTLLNNEIYQIHSGKALACRNETHFVCQTSPHLVDNLHSTIKNVELKSLDILKSAVTEVKSEADKKTNASLTSVKNRLFHNKTGLIPNQIFDKPETCKTLQWLWPFNLGRCIKNEIMFPVWRAYHDFYSELISNYDQWANNISNKSQSKTKSVQEIVNAEGAQILFNASRKASEGVNWVFFWLNAIAIGSTIWILMVAFKLLIFIACRILFDKKFAGASFTPMVNNLQRDRILTEDVTKKFPGGGLGFEVNPSDQNLISMTNVEGVSFSTPGKPILYAPLSLPCSRMITQQIHLDKHLAQNLVSFRIKNNCRIVRIDIGEDEAVLFNFSSLVAFTENVRISTNYSFDLSSLVRERHMQPIAKGPGSLYLCGRGGAIEVLPNYHSQFANMQDIIALDSKASFHIEGQIDWRSIYLRSFAIMPSYNSIIIQEAPHGSFNRGIKLWSRALFFVLPF